MRPFALALLLALPTLSATVRAAHLGAPLRAIQTDDRPRQNGLWARFYFVGKPMEILPILVANQTPNVSVVLPTLDLKTDDQDRNPATGAMDYTFLAHVEGFLVVPSAGKYALRLSSDDGSRLLIDGKVVVDHDGLHSMTGKSVELELAAGEHSLAVQMFQTYGGWGLKLEWRPPGASAFEVVPESALRSHAGEMLITSPGVKKVLLPLEKGSPGDGLPLEDVHPSYDLATVRPEGFEPRVGGMDWLPDGRLVVSTWDTEGGVYILDGVQGDDRKQIHAKKFASGLAEPLGVACVGKRIFVLQKQELTELVDEDLDGVADRYTAISSDWGVTANFHEFAFGLVFKDGWFYANLATAIQPGGRSTQPQNQDRGKTIRIRLTDGAVETVARGERTPNGIGLGTDGEIFFCDNQGDWLPSSKLLHLKQGAFYGSRSVLLEKADGLVVTPPVLWLPQNEIGNSPSQPALIPEGNGPYSGQMCHGDVTQGGVARDFIEKIEGEYQGCVFRWTQGLEAGINRLTWGPDHALYVGGIGSTGNWGQEGKRRFGLQRLKYNGKPAFEMLAVRAKTDGFEIELTQPLAPGVGWDKENYFVQDWTYVPTNEYGGPKVDLRELPIRAVAVSSDRRKIDLWIDGLKTDRVVYFRLVGDLAAESGQRLWSTEAWYTLNKIPKDLARDVARAAQAPKVPQNVLGEADKAAGWKSLFDGQSLRGWHNFKKTGAVAGWKVEDGALVCAGGGDDLVTDEDYADFELELEWKIHEGGNSGIFFHATEENDYVWQSAPEMQVLDNDRHPDGRDPRTSAGANYALHAPPRDVTHPVGLWNRARILVRGSHVEHWLNGTKLCEYELWSDDWKALVAASKFASMPRYGQSKTGRIALQDHGDFVAFRNVKIRCF